MFFPIKIMLLYIFSEHADLGYVKTDEHGHHAVSDQDTHDLTLFGSHSVIGRSLVVSVTVNSEIFARILFSRIVLKDTCICYIKIRD